MPNKQLPLRFQAASSGITGTAVLAVAQPAIAASGTFTPLAPVTGTAALTVPQPQIAASGTIPVTTPPAVGGRPHGRKRAVVHRYPPRRRTEVPDFTVNDLYEGAAACGVRVPRVRGMGTVESPGESAADDRMVMELALEDEDLALALTMADTWLN